jgi:uncharacterized DUF497 family protein
MYQWDEAKRAWNRKWHGVDFADAARFEWGTALIEIDDRHDDGELRERAIGFIGVRLHVMVFVRHGDNVRIINLRKATKAEVRHYVEQ